MTLSSAISQAGDIKSQLDELLSKAEVEGRRVRLLGVSVSKLSAIESTKDEQLTLL